LGHIKKDGFLLKRQAGNQNVPDGNNVRERQAQMAAETQPERAFAFLMNAEVRERQTQKVETPLCIMVKLVNYTEKPDEVNFILDSGASDHLVNNINLFSVYANLNLNVAIEIAKRGEFVNATAKGQVKLNNSGSKHYTACCIVRKSRTICYP